MNIRLANLGFVERKLSSVSICDKVSKFSFFWLMTIFSSVLDVRKVECKFLLAVHNAFSVTTAR
jgi:hypothetical protein